MRVIAGHAKGHHLKAPKTPGTRPTSDKVRGAIFAMIESLLEASRSQEGAERDLWEGMRVLDLFAGTGALGIEALSRGASKADFVEADLQACRVIRENLAHTGLAGGARVHCISVRQFLAHLPPDLSYDLVLADPPYAESGLDELLDALGAAGLVRSGGWLVFEHSRRQPLPDDVGALKRLKLRRHGDTDISIYVC